MSSFALQFEWIVLWFQETKRRELSRAKPRTGISEPKINSLGISEPLFNSSGRKNISFYSLGIFDTLNYSSEYD